MYVNIGINLLEFWVVFLCFCIVDVYIFLMLWINGEVVYIEDGECIELIFECVVMNIFYYIEVFWINEFGQEEGYCLVCDVLE